MRAQLGKAEKGKWWIYYETTKLKPLNHIWLLEDHHYDTMSQI